MIRGTFTNIIKLFTGMNIADTPDVITKKGQAAYIIDCFNYPDGGVAKLFGRQKHNAVAIPGSLPITGLYSLETIAVPTFYCIAGSDIFIDNNGTWNAITGTLAITPNQNNLWSFVNFENLMVGASYLYNQMIQHDGLTDVASAVPNAPAGRYLAVLEDQLFVFNTSDQPKLGFWSAIDDLTTWDLANSFLSFESTESDNSEITGVKEHLNTLVVMKETSIMRLYGTGTVPAFEYYVITPSIGCESHYSIQNIPPIGKYPERLIWMGSDNFYQLMGDDVVSCGDDIQPFFSNGPLAPFQINLSRSQYFESGIIQELNLYWCAFSSGSETENNYIFILDYKNMLWSICDFEANCFCERTVNGQKYLYSGRYDGFVAQHNAGIFEDCGTAYASQVYFPWLDFGDTQMQKKLIYIVALFNSMANTGLSFEYRTDLDDANFTLEMTESSGQLDINFVLGTSALGGVSLQELIGDMHIRCKRVQFLITDNAATENFNLLAMGILWDKVRGYRIG